MSKPHRSVSIEVNGRAVQALVEPRLSLLDFLRDVAGQLSVHVGCEHGVCGACTVLLDGEAARSCICLAVAADGAQVTTLEGITPPGGLHPVQQAFWDEHALQCGYCTPGMILAVVDLLRSNPDPTDDEIRDAIGGNLCRCTGYVQIVRAARRAAEEMRSR